VPPLAIHGLLNVDKPVGMTSHQVVERLRRWSGQRRVGHAGTLDPLASGVLLIGFGQGTRVLQFLTEAPKLYRAQLHLGVTTTTYDAEGEIVATGDVSNITRADFEATLSHFHGLQEQMPPMFSALKLHGRPLYRLARAGREVPRQPRRVEIRCLKLLDWEPPLATVEVLCSKGTYLRSLAHDIGRALGCGAHLSQLVRLQVGPFHLREACRLDEVEEAFAQGSEMGLLHPLDAPLLSWMAAILGEEKAKAVMSGRPIPLGQGWQWADGVWCRAYSEQGNLLALLRFRAEASCWHPEKVFPSEEGAHITASLDISVKLGMIQEMRLEEATVDAYCMKCREKREIQGAKQVTLKNGRPAVQGTCGVCGTKLFRIGKM